MTTKTQALAGASVPATVLASAVEGLPELLDKVVIKRDQDTIRVSLVKLDARIHANAVQCLLHAEKHGDTSLMRRLLIDIIDAKSGYRRQGVIAWMREFSPMELKGDVIQLTGTINGERRPFRCEEANKTPFTQLASAREMVPLRPVFRDGIVGKIERAVREYKGAIDNTKIENGKVVGPKDPTKPFYDGIRLEEMDVGFDKIESTLTELLSFSDSTADVYAARLALKKAEVEVDAAREVAKIDGSLPAANATEKAVQKATEKLVS